jgi:hypothetical protein
MAVVDVAACGGLAVGEYCYLQCYLHEWFVTGVGSGWIWPC